MPDEGQVAGSGDARTLAALHLVYLETLPGSQHTHPRVERARSLNQFELVAALDALAESKTLDPLQKWHVIASALNRTNRFDDDPAVLEAMGRVVSADIVRGRPSAKVMADRLTSFVRSLREPAAPPVEPAPSVPRAKKPVAGRKRPTDPAVTSPPRQRARSTGTQPRRNGRG